MGEHMIGKRRTSFEIIHGILSTCNNGGVNKTTVMYRNSLSHTQLDKYLEWLTDREFINRDDFGQFRITPRGQAVFASISGLFHDIGTIEL